MVCVGAIAGAFGVHGEARIKSFCADPGAVGDYGPLSLEDGRTLTLRLTRPVKGGFAARLGGVATREDAEALKGQRLYAPRERLPALPNDEFYHADLIGLEVVDTGGHVLGRVRAVHDHGAGDLLEIAVPGSPRPVLLPFTLAAVPTVDPGAGRIVADPPLGLFDDDRPDGPAEEPE
ncbi:16S rRNA processing protein RimM [Rhodobacteraceae bacterium 2CG4]|uniref:Ribosome maturation factor RimM n=2 Tax=Halovulum marinum TaxID=2662447 RepID=A0A6L5YW00_9RHOB|nr:16S rRNA processing protein RimM [Halovulum marinum]